MLVMCLRILGLSLRRSINVFFFFFFFFFAGSKAISEYLHFHDEICSIRLCPICTGFSLKPVQMGHKQILRFSSSNFSPHRYRSYLFVRQRFIYGIFALVGCTSGLSISWVSSLMFSLFFFFLLADKESQCKRVYRLFGHCVFSKETDRGFTFEIVTSMHTFSAELLKREINSTFCCKEVKQLVQ